QPAADVQPGAPCGVALAVCESCTHFASYTVFRTRCFEWIFPGRALPVRLEDILFASLFAGVPGHAVLVGATATRVSCNFQCEPTDRHCPHSPGLCVCPKVGPYTSEVC
ncbi:unnamed protein product, partial [Ectocarpus fasciculatus]